jgi:hypothetical protein
MVSSVTTVTSPSPPSGTSGPTPPPAHPARCARALAGRGDEGDDPATLEEAEDALAGALDDLLDILLRGCGRGMEYLALAVSPFGDFGTTPAPTHPARFARALAVWRVNTVEKQAAEVGGAPEVAGCAMNGGDRAALAARKSAISLALATPSRHGVGEDAATECGA